MSIGLRNNNAIIMTEEIKFFPKNQFGRIVGPWQVYKIGHIEEVNVGGGYDFYSGEVLQRSGCKYRYASRPGW